MKKKVRLLSALMTMVLVLSCLLPCAAAVEQEPTIDLTLLETEAHPNAINDVETRRERHERLISEGYKLQELTVANRRRNSHIEGPDGNLYETRVVTSVYTQPTHTATIYGEDYLNVITQANVSMLIEFAVGAFWKMSLRLGGFPLFWV